MYIFAFLYSHYLALFILIQFLSYPNIATNALYSYSFTRSEMCFTFSKTICLVIQVNYSWRCAYLGYIFRSCRVQRRSLKFSRQRLRNHTCIAYVTHIKTLNLHSTYRKITQHNFIIINLLRFSFVLSPMFVHVNLKYLKQMHIVNEIDCVVRFLYLYHEVKVVIVARDSVKS